MFYQDRLLGWCLKILVFPDVDGVLLRLEMSHKVKHNQDGGGNIPSEQGQTAQGKITLRRQLPVIAWEKQICKGIHQPTKVGA